MKGARIRGAAVIAASAAAWVAACGREPSDCPLDIGIDIKEFAVDAYNGVVKNSGGGSALSFEWTCPNGGSATITGTANTSTVSFDLVLLFRQCADFSLGMLTLDGMLEDVTTNGSSPSGGTVTVHSTGLGIMGTEDLCHADPINATCAVDITEASTTICGLSSN